MYHWRVLYFLPATMKRLITMSSTSTVMKTIDTIEAKVAKGTERIIISIHVNVHVMIANMVTSAIGGSPLASRAKEYIEGVGASKERSKRGMWIPMEGVVICSPLSTR